VVQSPTTDDVEKPGCGDSGGKGLDDSIIGSKRVLERYSLYQPTGPATHPFSHQAGQAGKAYFALFWKTDLLQHQAIAGTIVCVHEEAGWLWSGRRADVQCTVLSRSTKLQYKRSPMVATVKVSRPLQSS
jgi:hypothetical protein